jgi:nucleoid DNA-binding protein
MASKKKSVTKSNIIADITKATGLKRVQVAAIVDGIFGAKGIIVSSLKQGRSVSVAGFGKFYLHHKKATRAGKKLMFGEMKHVKAHPASDVPKFKYLKAAKDAI